MSKNYVATIDGVLVRVGDRAVSLYQDGPVPQGADENHVALLVERGLLTESDAPADADATGDGRPAKSAVKDEWVAYAMSQGASQDDAEALTKDQLIEQYGS